MSQNESGSILSKNILRYRRFVNYVKPLAEDALTEHLPFCTKLFYRKPYHLYIEPTNDCNLSCTMCYRGKRKIGYINFDLFRKVVDEAADIGITSLFLHGVGEPLLHPNFKNMLSYTMKRKRRIYQVGFFTNGMLLDKAIADLIVEVEINKIFVSMDGIGAVNERIRRGSVYSVLEQNLNYLLDSRGKRAMPQIFIETTISSQTDEELREIARVWRNRVDNIFFSGAVNARFKYVNLGRVKKWDPNFKLGKFCMQPFRFMGVLWNGDVSFCCHDFNARGVVGNVASSTLTDVWNGETLSKVRRGVISRKVKGTLLCSQCEKYEFLD